ncbi:MAG: hypothetical protein K6C36_06900, partial [Clostridia bacterium]|nr:hypothetical protein [Clostridia bacterium]
MRKLKTALAFVLAVVLIMSTLVSPALAANSESKEEYTFSETMEHRFYQFVDQIIFIFGRVLNALIPGKDWAGKTPSIKSYEPENFYPGKTSFDTEPVSDAHWSMGFGKASFLENIDPCDGSYYLAGSLEAFKGRAPVEVL